MAACTICHDDLASGLAITQCGHVYHRRCLTQWFDKSTGRICPDCRSQLPRLGCVRDIRSRCFRTRPLLPTADAKRNRPRALPAGGGAASAADNTDAPFVRTTGDGDAVDEDELACCASTINEELQDAIEQKAVLQEGIRELQRSRSSYVARKRGLEGRVISAECELRRLKRTVSEHPPDAAPPVPPRHTTTVCEADTAPSSAHGGSVDEQRKFLIFSCKELLRQKEAMAEVRTARIAQKGLEARLTESVKELQARLDHVERQEQQEQHVR
jgi:hypothetical protein